MTQSDLPQGATTSETESGVYKTLLESTKAIPWKIDWDTKRFEYIGPQIESLLGWSPESWITVQDWVDRIHPDDRQWVFDYCVSQSVAGVDHEADYRALAADGSIVWLRDVVHVVRRADGSVEALVGFMFDISEHKRTEERVQRLEKELADLSFDDSLTKVANRKWFDTLIEGEWSIALRGKTPLSLMMVAIDAFHQYDETYGRAQADECLRRVANALDGSATRPRDFLARYDGEVFAIVLPETDERGADRVAERCRDALLGEAIPHEASSISSIVTISIGIGTTVPVPAEELPKFIERVARRLERAKPSAR